MIKTKTKLNITLKEASRLFKVANNFADIFEDFLESKKMFSSEFTKGLQTSVEQAKSGRLKKISSLSILKN